MLPMRTFAPGVLLVLLACTPALNWRDVREPDLALAAQFPCKPQRVTQSGMGLLQCEAAGSRFMLSWRHLPEPSRARDELGQLPAALAQRLGASAPTPLPGALPVGALDWPGSGRYALAGGQRPAWLQTWAQGSIVLQALVLGGDEAAALLFMDALRRAE